MIKIKVYLSYSLLNHVEDAIDSKGDTNANVISWSAFHAQDETAEKDIDISVLLPLFREESKSVAMIKHSMDVIKQAVDRVNQHQTPVIALDQPLYTIAKLMYHESVAIAFRTS